MGSKPVQTWVWLGRGRPSNSSTVAIAAFAWTRRNYGSGCFRAAGGAQFPSLDVASGIAMIPEWAVAPSFIVAGGMPGAIRDVDVRHFHQNIRVLQRRGQERAAEGRGNEGEVLVSKMPRSCLAGMRPPCVQRRLCEGSWLALRTALLHRPKSQPRSWREQAHV